MSDTGELAARKLRTSLGNKKEPIASLRDILTSRDDIVLVERPMAADLDGAYAYDQRLQAGFVYINARPVWTRRRFTMAHEFGHHLLGHHNRVDKDIFDLYDPAEREANGFAAELLMPAAGIIDAARVYDAEGVAELAAHYMVSGRAMIVRLSFLRIVNNALKRKLDAEYDAKFYNSYWKTSPDRTDTARTSFPDRYSQAVLDLYKAGDISRNAAKEALDLTENDAQEVLPSIEQEQEVGVNLGER